MSEKLQPYQYWHLYRECSQLVNAYHSVNDRNTILALQGQARETIGQGSSENIYAEEALEFAMDKELTREKFARYFEGLKEYVEPFKAPSRKQLEKVFRKVKKLDEPAWDEVDLRENSYYGWNDPGSGRKYILTHDADGKLEGVYGTLSTEVIKGACAICKQIDGVSMFLATVKSGAQGTYTKRGNYICRNSQKCNQQLYSLDGLNEFMETVK